MTGVAVRDIFCPQCGALVLTTPPDEPAAPGAGKAGTLRDARSDVDVCSGVYSLDQAARRLGFTYSTAWRRVKDGTFPVPVLRLGGRTRVVSVAVLERFLDGPGEL